MFPTTSLKLYSYGLQQLHDPNWTGMVLFDRIKQCVRGRAEPKQLLRKPLERGLPFYLGQWLYEDFLEAERVRALQGEYKAWALDDLVQMLGFHGAGNDMALTESTTLVEELDTLFEQDEKQYFQYLDSEYGIEKIEASYDAAITANRSIIRSVKKLYAEDFADRMVHDRQLCFFVSELVVAIGFDGDESDSGPKQWVAREYWPSRLKRILQSRDRGKCSSCGKDLIAELEASIHIDHMIPLVSGGCNDIVNLQLLCDSCNSMKSGHSTTIHSSVPKYIQRAKK